MDYSTYPIKKVTPLRNEDYYIYLWKKINEAKRRFWAATFIVSIASYHDHDKKVRNFLKHLAKASSNHLDTRVLLGNSDTISIEIPTTVSFEYMKKLGLNTRLFVADKKDYSLHSKYVIVDDEIIILGSHNWSQGGFGNHIEDSIAIQSSSLNKILSKAFLDNWEKSKPI